MRFARFIAALLIFVAPAVAQNSTNAASDYRQAFAALKQANPKVSGNEPEIKQFDTTPITPSVREMLDRSAGALQVAQTGTIRTQCDWGLGNDPNADTSHRGAARQLVALFALRGRERLQDENHSGSLNDLLDAVVIARDLGRDGSLTSALIATGLEERIDAVIGAELWYLDKKELAGLETSLKKLRPAVNLRDALLSHERIVRIGTERAIQNAKSREELITALSKFEAIAPHAAEAVDDCGGTVAGFNTCLDRAKFFYERWAQHFNEPPEKFQADYEDDLANATRMAPLVPLIAPNVGAVRWAVAYSDTERALLRAAIAVRESGPKALAKHPDPYDGKPFSIIATSSSFLLASELKRDGKPMAMMVTKTESLSH